MQCLEEIQIEGFRGINEKTSIEFGENFHLVYGPNGTGKSSIVQAILWCLTGKVPYLSGGDFQREDAIVNLFSKKKKANVSLFLNINGKKVIVTRTRTMKNTSSPGSQPLTVECEEKIFKQKNAESFLSNLLKSELDEIGKNVILHQQTIQESISMKPADRSKAIDLLLGTLEIREFVEALDPKKQIINAKGDLELRINALQRDRVQFAIGLRDQLEKKKQDLVSKGYSEKEFSLDSIMSSSKGLMKEVEGIAESLSAEHPKFGDLKPNTVIIDDNLNTIESEVGRLERFRVDSLSKIQSDLMKFQGLESRYRTIKEQIDKLGDISIDGLIEEKGQVEEKLSEVLSRIKNCEGILSQLSSDKTIVDNNLSRLNILKLDISKIVEEFGDLENHSILISGLEKEIVDMDEQLSTISKNQQLVSLAITYLNETKSVSCPVCNTKINYIEVTKNLEKSISEHLRDKASTLRSDKKEKQEKIQLIHEASRNLKEFRKEQTERQSDNLKIYQNLSEILDKKIDDSFDFISETEKIKSSFTEANTESTTLQTRIFNINSQIEKPSQLRRELDEIERQIQTELSLKTKDVLKKGLDLKIEYLTNNKKPFEVTENIDLIRGKLKRLEDVIDYLKYIDQLEELESELPNITREIQALQTNHKTLELLEGALIAIREAIILYEKSVVTNELASLENEINEYYSQLQGHPYFKKLIIEIEKDFPLQYVFKSSDLTEEYSSYITTRFSQAQGNIAALSIFLSNNKRMAGALPLLILDDPTQSMDPEHIEALTKLLNVLCKSRQVIIATHDDGFRDSLIREIQAPDLIEFNSWNISGPIREDI